MNAGLGVLRLVVGANSQQPFLQARRRFLAYVNRREAKVSPDGERWLAMGDGGLRQLLGLPW
ncbi:MAG: hypothetical protein H6707_21480 [Deltaproteobacteria bacterium]|nr:hypothetical protein [Deltaproteobacteria bacterium]